MNRDDIIRMAQECGYWSGQTVEMNDVGLERFAALVAAAERDECAKVCEDELCYCCWEDDAQDAAEHLAETIRARGEK
jgi:hypothetical protein